MEKYEKRGYLNSDFKMFHLIDKEPKNFNYHYHDFNKIIIFIRGNVTYTIEGKSYELKPYDIVLVNSGEVHKPIINEECIYERIIIYISPEFINSYKKSNYDLSYCFIKSQSEKSNVLRLDSIRKSKLYQVSRELEQAFTDNDYANELYYNILFLEFMIHLNRATIHNFINYVETNYSNKKIIEIIDYLNCHLTESLSIDMLSETFYMNKYYLMHSFKEETGYSIGTYLSTKRLLLAKQLIQTGTPITAACYDCGFKNYSTFLKAYKKSFHDSPRKLLSQ